MKILVINCGSSSLKYQLFDMDTESMIAKGNCERIGVDGKIGGSTADGRKFEYEVPFENHTKAFLEVKKVLTEGDANKNHLFAEMYNAKRATALAEISGVKDTLTKVITG